ncbi:hypothetical protein UCYN_00210 [Candidatus Atelocyanobacterium thalassa isolate ALOHA]|jgi:hypothetical protein|uniref:Uncharacterized protein n=1 Tax=Atelocyanobacterium thalassa (isolate ALOHA) TaxID=1453429 RepID=D3EMS8_ATETH|nr:hypothetical protein UCYN_00210 [Candidatus Atelocyanobacterium thalassa isolate ALOHA]
MLLNLLIFITSITIIWIIIRWLFTIMKSIFFTLVSIIIILTLLKLGFDTDGQELWIKVKDFIEIWQDFFN